MAAQERGSQVKTEFIVTLDIDWAPDYMIDHVVELLDRYGVAATWFVTHDSAAVQNLRRNPLFEVGIHPNFLPGSTHGADPIEILDHVLSIVPEAVSSRSHAVVQSGPLLELLSRKVRIDSTIFLPEMPGIRPVKFLSATGDLWRIPFFWADDYELRKYCSSWDLEAFVSAEGLKVMLFHPVHVFLNTPNLESYQRFRKETPRLTALAHSDARLFRHSGFGTEALFMALLRHLSAGGARRLKDCVLLE